MLRRPVLQLFLGVLLACAWVGSSGVQLRADDTVTVFAAASLTNVVDAMAPLVKSETGLTIRASYGSSATLARQIEAGAPADLFISADQEWMQYLVERRLVVTPVVPAVATNALVIVSPAGTDTRLAIARGFPLRGALGPGRLAVGDPASVPAGKYARAALQFYGAWDSVQDRLAPAENVRVALQFVARSECPLGIVYATDARAEPGVRVVATFPEASHDPIVYPAAVTTRAAGSAATRVLAWLQSPPARRVLVEHGFGTPGRTDHAVTASTTEIVLLSLRVAACATLGSLPIAIGVAVLLSRGRFPGKTLVNGIVHLPLVLPPVVTGYVLLRLLGRHGPIGALLEPLGIVLAFRWTGAALAAAVMGFPLMVGAIRVALDGVDRRLEGSAATLGAGPAWRFVTVTLPLIAPGLASGMVLAFAKALGEFGATITFVSNIPGETQTLALAVYSLIQTPSGDARALRLVLLSVALSFAALIASETLVRRSAARRERR